MKTEINEMPLEYWEKESYFLVLTKDNFDELFDNMVMRIEKIEGIKIKEKRPLTMDEPGYMKLVYDNDEYDVGFYPSEVRVPDMYISQYYYFTDKQVEAIKSTTRALTIYMPFSNNPLKSYHLQLKIAVSVVPNLLGILDESAEKVLHPEWVKMSASSKVLPSANDLYTIQAISGDNDEIWFHTHGLCRCGITELEILESNRLNQRYHYNLISTFANHLIEQKDKSSPLNEGACIGLLSNKQYIIATYVDWVSGLKEYPNLTLGNLEDRQHGHNTKTSIIFVYENEEAKINKKFSKVSIYDKLWGDNPMFFFTNAETNRMKELAQERFDIVKEQLNKNENQIMVKIGISVCEDEKEHIWFEIMEFEGDKFKAKLTQEPYYIENMHKGDESWYTVADVTDWIIYTKDCDITPGKVYILLDK